MLGYTEKELIGQPLASIAHPDDFENDVQLAGRLCANQIPRIKIEKRYIRKDGETVWAKVTATVVRNKRGKIPYGIMMVEDISREKLLEKQLIQIEKLRTVGEISATISHEFRNSLTSIRMLLELLQESENLEFSERKSLSVVLKSVRHMDGITTQLLKFSKPSPPEFRIENLNNVVEESLYFLNGQIAKEEINLKKRLNNSLKPMPLDTLNLKEALVNMFFNSVAAISAKEKSNGPREILVETRKHYLEEPLRDFTFPATNSPSEIQSETFDGLELELRGKTECAVIEISDTGDGIDPKNVKKIFDPFFSTKRSGTGLGLAMVKRIVNSHGGIISVASEIGKGTKFCIYLPLPNGK